MSQRHRHYDVIVAFAEGKKIQHKPDGEWLDWNDPCAPTFNECREYRVKPEPRHDWVVEYAKPHTPGRVWCMYNLLYSKTEKEVNSFIVEQSKTYPWEYRYRKVEAVS